MLKHTYMFALSASLLFVLSGCGNLNTPKPKQDIISSKGIAVSQTYIFNDPVNNSSINQKDVLGVIVKNMSNISGFANKTKKHSGSYAFYNIQGKTIELNDNKIIVTYINGDNNCHKCTNKESTSKVIFNIPYQIIETQSSTFKFDANMPTSYSILPHTDAIGMDHPLLDATNILENDVFKMLDSLNKRSLTINKFFDIKGEINTKYQDKAVFANFKRMLGQYNWDKSEVVSEVKKQNTFALKINENELPMPVYVEVFPYREGSKVVYSIRLNYTISSDGTSTITKKDINGLSNKIERIIND